MPSEPEMAQMIEEAIVDAYTDEERQVGWQSVLEQNLGLPFTTYILGDVEVEVVGIECSAAGEIVAVCERGRRTQRVPLLDLELPDPPPEGYGWIEAYRRWRG